MSYERDYAPIPPPVPAWRARLALYWQLVRGDRPIGWLLLLGKAGRLTETHGVGLTVNTVTPGFIGTEMLEHIPAKVLERIVGQIPLGRLGKPEEVARVVHFLAADASSYITGQVWGVNGGLDM
jgi:hypothetical protein